MAFILFSFYNKRPVSSSDINDTNVYARSWSGSHMKWGQSFRIRHITTGRYLCLDEEKGLLVVDPERANTKLSAFCFRASKV